MFNWTVINDVPRDIANSTGAVGAESIVMSPVMTEATLVPKTSGGGVTRSGKVVMGTGIGGAVLSIVAKKMTSKAFGKRASRGQMKSSWTRKYLSGRREYTSAVREADVLSRVSRDRECSVVWIS